MDIVEGLIVATVCFLVLSGMIITIVTGGINNDDDSPGAK
jgi:hypothetical protein